MRANSSSLRVQILFLINEEIEKRRRISKSRAENHHSNGTTQNVDAKQWCTQERGGEESIRVSDKHCSLPKQMC